jgi:hypothetical protein
MMHKLIPVAALMVLCCAIEPAGAQDSKEPSTASPAIAGSSCNDGAFTGAVNVAGTAVGLALAGAIQQKSVRTRSVIAEGGSEATKWGARKACEWWNGPPTPAVHSTIQPSIKPITFDETLSAPQKTDAPLPPTRICPPVYGQLSLVCIPN